MTAEFVVLFGWFGFLAILFVLGLWTMFNKNQPTVERFRGGAVAFIIVLVLILGYFNAL